MKRFLSKATTDPIGIDFCNSKYLPQILRNEVQKNGWQRTTINPALLPVLRFFAGIFSGVEK
jgi:hypothetical protein